MIKEDVKLFSELSSILDEFVSVASKGCASWNELDFTGCGEEENLNAYWDSKEIPSCWSAMNDSIDPLSLYLVKEQPERQVKASRDDNETIETLSIALDRMPSWIRGFQCGWLGQANSSTNISGYITGRSLRLKYLK